MPTYQRCDKSVATMAMGILNEFESHRPLIDAKVQIDYVFAFPDIDPKTEEPINDALTKNGVKCLGLARKIGMKDRAMGRGDCEISLDGVWWEKSTHEERRAVLDHELHHFAVKKNKLGVIATDDLGRPKLELRKHDVEVGWFNIIAERHGSASQERKQATWIVSEYGQYYFPVTLSTGHEQTRLQRLERAE